jgi:hypothetical protein
MPHKESTYATALPFKEFYVRGEGVGKKNVETFSDFVAWCKSYPSWYHDQRIAASAERVIPCWVEKSGEWRPAGVYVISSGGPKNERCPESPSLKWLYETLGFTPTNSSTALIRAGRGFRQKPFTRTEFDELSKKL